jgi:hypothetical protein
MDQPNDFILDPVQPQLDADTHFKPQLELLNSLVAYGTYVILRCIKASDRGLVDSVALGALLRHFVAMLDAAALLVGQGALYAAAPLSRSMLESSFYLDWILRDDSDQRARAFYVADLRRELLWAQRGQQGTREGQAIERSMAQMGINLEFSEPVGELAAQVGSRIRELLGSDPYREISAWFDANRRGANDKSWYSVCGPPNLRELSRELLREGEYDMIYGPGSDVAHATAFSRQVRFSRGRMHMTPIRHLDGLDSLVRVLCVLSFRTYRAALDHYRPEEAQNFARKYSTEWKNAFLNIPHPEYSAATVTSVDL